MNLLTVVLLTYNHEESIARAIDSILEQKTDFDFDIFILEDCSTDRTAEICRQYKEKYPERFRLFLNKQNMGVMENYKNGLIHVDAKYHAFLEGDDYWCDENKLQMQVDILESHPDCILCSHRTLYKKVMENEERLIPREPVPSEKTTFNLSEKLTVHASSRVHRNIIDLNPVPAFMFMDENLLSFYLTKGDMYFIDRVMSVYNWTGTGYWSGQNMKARKLFNIKQRYDVNRYLNFVCDYRYYAQSKLLKALKGFLGVKLAWFIYYHLERSRVHLKYLFKK